MLWGKPVIHLLTYNVTDTSGFSKYGAAAEINRFSQLPKAIIKILEDKSYREVIFKGQKKLLRDYFSALGDKAINGTIGEIKKIVSS